MNGAADLAAGHSGHGANYLLRKNSDTGIGVGSGHSQNRRIHSRTRKW